MIDNPYAAPKALTQEHVVPQMVRWPPAIGFLAGSVGLVVIYMSIALHFSPRHLPLPVWPTILVPLVLSIMSAIRTRSLIIAPLTCLCGVTSGSLMFAAVRGWAGANLNLVFPIAVLLSLPSLFIAIDSRRSGTAVANPISSDHSDHSF